MRCNGYNFALATLTVSAAEADCLQWQFDRWNNPHCLSWGWVDGNYPGGYVPPPAYGYSYATPYAGVGYVPALVSPYLPAIPPPVRLVRAGRTRRSDD